MKKFLLLAPLAFLALPITTVSSSAETVVIKERRHSDNGLHRGWRNGRGHSVRKVIVHRDMGHRGTITKKVTRTSANGDRVTKKVTREIN